MHQHLKFLAFLHSKNKPKICKIDKLAKNHFSRADAGFWGVFLRVLGASLCWKVVLEFWFVELFWAYRNGTSVPKLKILNIQIAKYLIFGYLDIWQGAPNMTKWGIPEKSTKNAAQKRWPRSRRTFQSKVITKNRFSEISPYISPWALRMVFALLLLDL